MIPLLLRHYQGFRLNCCTKRPERCVDQRLEEFEGTALGEPPVFWRSGSDWGECYGGTSGELQGRPLYFYIRINYLRTVVYRRLISSLTAVFVLIKSDKLPLGWWAGIKIRRRRLARHPVAHQSPSQALPFAGLAAGESGTYIKI